MAARLIINGKTHTQGEDLRDYVKASVIVKMENVKKHLQVIESYKKEKKEHNEAIERNKEKPSLMTCTKQGIVHLYAKCMARKGTEVVVKSPVGSIVQTDNNGTNIDSTVGNNNLKRPT
jgi:hypothetical protein